MIKTKTETVKIGRPLGRGTDAWDVRKPRMRPRRWVYVQTLSRWVIGLGAIVYTQLGHTTTIQTVAVIGGAFIAVVIIQLGIDAIIERSRPS
jgi:hypothetical protein